MAEKAGQPTFADSLKEALNRDKFLLYRQVIQPIAPFSDECVFQEILVRHIEEEEQHLPPGAFFATLEDHNLLYTLDRWVVNRVIRWFLANYVGQRTWSATRCSINLSGDSVSRAGFSGFVKEQLKTSRMPPGKICFEIAEADAEAHAVMLEQLIAELRPLGCAFILTGYEGEHVPGDLLQALGIDFVKIGGHITESIHRDSASIAKAASIHNMCRSRNIRTIGTFVELAETLDVLRRLGVNYAQGFGVAKPEPLT